MQTTKDPRSTGSLLSDVLGSIGTLLRQEVDLARAEVDENLKRATRALGLLVVALVLFFIAMSVLVTTAISALVLAGVAEIMATLIVGVVTLILAVILAVIGVKRLKLSSLAPSRAARNVKRDAAVMKEAYNDR
ncbi:phage holin family protein [Loktanella sp. SALINAS62]|uniref:phage holin family protein n=1 Tax=Loktanella sp. SALINAS62 TaxID=2706124 RepID=UPI001B8D5FEC|nr:phage holin family protein [Loktanella sp. SALINAS62]MBS1301065.1 phage holin family protein [Loktanella sp. SALINAS62]